jgi:hypothetical protein
MADASITAAVGAHPAPNSPADVKIVQNLLGKVTPPLTMRVEETGTADTHTLHAIREFQSRFMSKPDSRVDPGGRTIWHLGEGFVAKYIHCDARQKKMLDRDLINAQMWLDRVNIRLAALDADATGKVKRVFHIDVSDRRQMVRLNLLRQSYTKLRTSLNKSFPLKCESTPSLFGAYVDINDPTETMHFPPNHFQSGATDRITRLIHERSHSVFKIHHSGMTGSGQINFGQSADDDNGFTYEQALGNAYCWGWLAAALQPDYQPTGGGMTITGRPTRR